ncbi:MAG: M14 family zinc carboxypeptidase [Gemmatimonadota bacterium]|nr:M14 family zinc carboxypeptidase [Gemmatimonadota bacterium]
MTQYPFGRPVESPPDHLPPRRIGRSRDGRPIFAYRIGDGPLRVSLVGGCHADEPVGPRFLERLVRFLASPGGSALHDAATWFIIPHINPDGAAANAAWQPPGAERYDFVAYLRHRVRELPGDDIEFGFPRDEDDTGARPENRAAWDFWRAHAPFDLHVSMHGMGMAAGPYFLVERSWWPSFGEAAATVTREVAAAGYTLHDVERNGEKGFHRLAKGFCSRPDSRAMRRHFLDLGDPDTAARFRPSSMEAVRALGGDPLTLVTEMPLFITPGVGDELGPPDPVLERWRERVAQWEGRLRGVVGSGGGPGRGEEVAARLGAKVGAEAGDGGTAERAETEVREEMMQAGLGAMPVEDQMRFQWAFVRAGLGVVGARRA